MIFNFRPSNAKLTTASVTSEGTEARDSDSIIESVESHQIEQGLSVDGQADMIDEECIVFLKYRDLAEEFLKCASVCHECLVETDDQGKRYFQSSSPDEIAICQRLKEIGVEFQGIRKNKSYVKFFSEKRTFQMKMVGRRCFL